MEKVIPWDTGGGNIRLSFTGQGNGTIIASSDTENLTGKAREMTVSVQTTKGGEAILSLIIRQESADMYFRDGILLEDGTVLLAEDGKGFMLE